MKNIKIGILIMISLVNFLSFSDSVYAVRADINQSTIEGGSGGNITKCIYTGTEKNQPFSVTYSISDNGKGSVFINDVESDHPKIPLVNSFVYGKEFIVGDNTIKCPSYLTYEVEKELFESAKMKVSFRLNYSNKMKLINSINDNVKMSVSSSSIVNTCSYDNSIGGVVYIESYTDGTIQVQPSTINYDGKKVYIKFANNTEFVSYMTSGSCPRIATGSSYDYDTKKQKIYVSKKDGNFLSYYDTGDANEAVMTYRDGTKLTTTGDNLSGNAEYSCIYKGQIYGNELKISKFGNWFDVVYPNGESKSVSIDNASVNFPSSNCEDVFYSATSNSIRAIKENTNYTKVYISEQCHKYDDVEQFCEKGTCKITSVPCGSESETNEYGDCPRELAPIIFFLKKVVMNTLQIFVPIILILMATIDLVKAVMASDEKTMQEAIPKIIRRFAAAILMVFVTTIVSIVLNMFATSGVGEYNEWKACWIQED